MGGWPERRAKLCRLPKLMPETAQLSDLEKENVPICSARAEDGSETGILSLSALVFFGIEADFFICGWVYERKDLRY